MVALLAASAYPQEEAASASAAFAGAMMSMDYHDTARPQGAPGQSSSPHEQELPGLAGIGNVIHWIEELVMLLSGPLLTLGLGIALVDLLTGGDLLRALPFLLFGWGVC